AFNEAPSASEFWLAGSSLNFGALACDVPVQLGSFLVFVCGKVEVSEPKQLHQRWLRMQLQPRQAPGLRRIEDLLLQCGPGPDGLDGSAGGARKYSDYRMESAPVWDGERPESEYREYVRKLKLWLIEARERLPSSLIGKGILDAIPYASRLSSVVAHLSVEDITAENGWKEVVKCSEEAHDYLKVAKLEQAFNAAIFGGRRKAGQTITGYLATKKAAFAELRKQGLDLLENEAGQHLLGHLVMRQGGFSQDEQQRIRVLTDGSVDFRKVELAIRKVFADSIDDAGLYKGRSSYWGEFGEPSEEDFYDYGEQASYGDQTYYGHSLYPDDPDFTLDLDPFEDLLEVDDGGSVFLCLDEPLPQMLDEDEAVAYTGEPMCSARQGAWKLLGQGVRHLWLESMEPMPTIAELFKMPGRAVVLEMGKGMVATTIGLPATTQSTSSSEPPRNLEHWKSTWWPFRDDSGSEFWCAAGSDNVSGFTGFSMDSSQMSEPGVPASASPIPAQSSLAKESFFEEQFATPSEYMLTLLSFTFASCETESSGTALVDTAAQHGLIGSDTLARVALFEGYVALKKLLVWPTFRSVLGVDVVYYGSKLLSVVQSMNRRWYVPATYDFLKSEIWKVKGPRCVLRLFYVLATLERGAFETIMMQPQLRRVRRLAQQREAYEKKALLLQQREQALLAEAGERASFQPQRRVLQAEDHAEQLRPKVEHRGRSKFLTPVLRSDPNCSHVDTKHGCNSEWAWTKCVRCNAVEQVPKMDLGEMSKWNSIMIFQPPNYKTPTEKKLEKASEREKKKDRQPGTPMPSFAASSWMPPVLMGQLSMRSGSQGKAMDVDQAPVQMGIATPDSNEPPISEIDVDEQDLWLREGAEMVMPGPSQKCKMCHGLVHLMKKDDQFVWGCLGGSTTCPHKWLDNSMPLVPGGSEDAACGMYASRPEGTSVPNVRRPDPGGGVAASDARIRSERWIPSSSCESGVAGDGRANVMIGWLGDKSVQDQLGNVSEILGLVNPSNSVAHWCYGRYVHGKAPVRSRSFFGTRLVATCPQPGRWNIVDIDKLFDIIKQHLTVNVLRQETSLTEDLLPLAHAQVQVIDRGRRKTFFPQLKVIERTTQGSIQSLRELLLGGFIQGHLIAIMLHFIEVRYRVIGELLDHQGIHFHAQVIVVEAAVGNGVRHLWKDYYGQAMYISLKPAEALLPQIGPGHRTSRWTIVKVGFKDWRWLEKGATGKWHPEARKHQAVIVLYYWPEPPDSATYVASYDLTDREKAEVLRCHTNLGHPNNREFIRVLKSAGTRHDILQYVAREFQCPGCVQEKRPPTRLPSATPRVYDFNVILGVDVLFVHGASHRAEHPVLNITCLGTLYSTFGVIDARKRSSELTWKAFMTLWLRVFGPPACVLFDEGNEFVGKVFQEGLEQHGIRPIEINRQSPFELGTVERRGGMFKEAYYRSRELRQPLDFAETEMLVYEVSWAIQTLTNRSGYSPAQRVFGRQPRTTLDALSDGGEFELSPTTDSAWQRAHEFRMAARKALIELDAKARVRRAKLARPRQEINKLKFDEGEPVLVWKMGRRGSTAKVGLCWVILQNGHTVWVFKMSNADKDGLEAVPEEFLQAKELDLVDDEVSAVKDEILSEGQAEWPPAGSGTILKKWIRYDRGANRYRTSNSQGPMWSDVVQRITVDNETGRVIKREDIRGNEASRDLHKPLPKKLKSIKTVLVYKKVVGHPDPGVLLSDPDRPELDDEPVPEDARLIDRRVKRTLDDPAGEEGSAPQRSKVFGVWMADVQTEFGDRSKHVAVANARDLKLFSRVLERDMVFEHAQIYGSHVYLTKKSGKELNEKNFTKQEQELFNEAKLKEINTLEQGNSIRFITDPDEVQRVKKELGHRIMPSRFVLTKKSQELGEAWKAKARWILLGHRDPDALEVERFSPTPSGPTVHLAFQLIASQRFGLEIMDVTSAFGQSDAEVRKQGPLYASMPTTGIPGKEQWMLVEILTAIYGLVNAPATWRRTVRKVLLSLGYSESIYDPCLFILHYNAEERAQGASLGCAGLVLLDVDDFAQGGGARHKQLMLKLKDRFRLGKWGKFAVDWEGAVNKTIAELKKTSDCYLRIMPIDLSEGMWMAVSDASVANDSEKSQGGFVVAFAEKTIKDGKLAMFSINCWRSHRLKRVVKASLGSEALAMDDGLAELEWLRAMFAESCVANSTICDGSRFGPGLDSIMIVRQQDDAESILVTDARALYDPCHRRSGAAGLCRRAQIDVAVLAASAQTLQALVFWVPGTFMLADCLTKRVGNASLMRKVMLSGQYALQPGPLKILLDSASDAPPGGCETCFDKPESVSS
ncbi:RE1, partial [Symbiodinium necroappetens]